MRLGFEPRYVRAVRDLLPPPLPPLSLRLIADVSSGYSGRNGMITHILPVLRKIRQWNVIFASPCVVSLGALSNLALYIIYKINLGWWICRDHTACIQIRMEDKRKM